jgi:hypothetical protein
MVLKLQLLHSDIHVSVLTEQNGTVRVATTSAPTSQSFLIFCATLRLSIQQTLTMNEVHYVADGNTAKSPGFKK